MTSSLHIAIDYIVEVHSSLQLTCGSTWLHCMAVFTMAMRAKHVTRAMLWTAKPANRNHGRQAVPKIYLLIPLTSSYSHSLWPQRISSF